MSDAVQIELIRSTGIAFPAVVAAVFAYMGLRQGKRNFTQMDGRLDELLRMKGEAGEEIGRKREEQREKP